MHTADPPISAPWSRALPAVLAGAAAALCVWSVCSAPVMLEPGTPAWRRLVRGTDPSGRVGSRATVLLPGVDRTAAVPLLLDAGGSQGGAVVVHVAVDGAAAQPVRCAPGTPGVVVLPAAGTRGARLDLTPGEGPPVIVRRLGTARRAAPATGTLLGAVVVATVAAGLAWWGAPSALALGLLLAALTALAVSPPLLALSLPAAPALLRLLPAGLATLAAVAAAWSGGPAVRAAFLRGAALLAAAVFGVWVRAAFLPAAGSWDTEYWKAWMLRAESHGVTRVYGDPQPLDWGRLRRQATGEEPLWKVPRAGREYVVDYPPLAMAAWRGSLGLVRAAAPRLDRAEAENVAVKLPPVVGDLGGVLVLLWTWRHRARRALALAALYWALPVSWLSSAVLGFLDPALAPLVAAALVAAGAGRALACGLLLALAALVTPTALLVAPAAVMALLARRASVPRAVAAGTLVAAVAFLPFALAGTLSTALVQIWRLAFQERLSGGFPNPWWLLSYALSLQRGGGAFDPVPWVRVDSFSALARPAGGLLFLGVALWVAWRQRGRAGAGPAALAGAVLFFAYGMVAVGVHENHPHPLYLLLFATGLSSRRLRLVTAASSAVYVLNMLAMSGLGRFYGVRYAALQPLIDAAARFRMAAGFDATLLLTAVNLAAFAAVCWGLDAELRRLADTEPA